MTKLTEALLQQVKLMSELKNKLDHELQLIVARNADELMSLVNEKETLLNQINDNDGLLKEFRAGLELTDEQRQLADNGIELLKQCQHKTAINAKANEKNQIRVQRLRNIMIATRNKESLTYTSKGKTQGGLLGNSVKA